MQREKWRVREIWDTAADGQEFLQTLGGSKGQGGLASCSPWGHKQSDTTEWLNWAELKQDERGPSSRQCWLWQVLGQTLFLCSCPGASTARMTDGLWLGLGLLRQESQVIWSLKQLSNPPLSWKKLAWGKSWSISSSQGTHRNCPQVSLSLSTQFDPKTLHLCTCAKPKSQRQTITWSRKAWLYCSSR